MDVVTEVLGFINVSLYINSDATNISFWYVRFEDFDPSTGESTFVTGGAINSAQRDDSQNPTPMKTFSNYTLTFQLHWTAYSFAVGRCMRLSVTNSLFHMDVPSPYPFTAQLLVDSLSTYIDLPIVMSNSTNVPQGSPDFTTVAPAVSFRNDSCVYARETYVDSVTLDNTTGDAIVKRKDTYWHNVKGVLIEAYLEEMYYANDAQPWKSAYLGKGKQKMTLTNQPSPLDPNNAGMCIGNTPDFNSTTDYELLTWLNFTTDASNFYVSFARELYVYGILMGNQTFQQSFPRVFQ